MKRYLQLLGEMRGYQLPQAKSSVQDMEPDDELVIIVPDQSMAEAIQQWATGQGYTVSNPKRSGEGMTRWQVTVQKAVAPGERPPAGVPALPA
jgi:TusA-related sulfurtransferase